MGLLCIFDHWLPYVTALVVGLVVVGYLFLVRKLSYWKRRDIPYVEPSLIFGNVKESTLQRVHLGSDIKKLYKKLEGQRYGGVYFIQKPILMIRDPELIKTMLVKDFAHFVDHYHFLDETVDPLHGNSLFFMVGEEWRNMRIKLTPVFTSGKMKKMFHLITECAENLGKFLEGAASRGEDLEMRDVLARFTTDVIGSCAFGIKVNCLENPESEFRKMGKATTDAFGFMEGIKMLLLMSFPQLSKILNISFTKPEIATFFRKVVKESLEYREKNNIVRNDFVDLLLKLKKTGRIEAEDGEEGILPAEDAHVDFTDDVITAQAFVFFLAGFETSSAVMSFTLHELAIQPEIQKRLRDEIEKGLEENDGKLKYQSVLHDMKYLDNVVSETLRKYPAVFADRVCTKAYTIPGTNVTLDVGTVINIPITGLHYDPKYFPDPEKFDPDRFNEENKAKRPAYVYLPFGEGPRMCIGTRFALMQSKVGIASVLSQFEVLPCERTRIPFELDPKSIFMHGKDGTWLKIVKINDK